MTHARALRSRLLLQGTGKANLSLNERALRCIALALLIVYVGWQAYWLSHGEIPPSLFLAITGWPAPTTGGTRSIRAMLLGDWRLSATYNPMALPIIFMSALTLTWMFRHARSLRTKGLPRQIVASWVAILSIAWIIKLAQALRT